jgi:ABC-2 type transport system permease protein
MNGVAVAQPVKLARDTWLTFQYEAGRWARNRAVIAASLLQPVTFLLFFTPFLKAVLHTRTYGDTFQIYVPLLLCSMGLFGGLFSGFALLAAIRQGVVGRLRVTPLSRVGLLLGRELTFVLMTGFQAVLISAAGLVFGMRVRPANFVLALIVLAMMVLLGVSIAYGLALAVPNESVLPGLMTGLANPLSLLAGVLIPLSVAPVWVRDVALWNPFAWAANSMRALFQGHIGAPVVWEAFAILAGLATVAVLLSSRIFSREIA